MKKEVSDLLHQYSVIIMYKERRSYNANNKAITDLRNTNEISEICHKQQQPVFITKNGYGDLVVMSMETYEELLSTNQIDKAIFEAEREVVEGAELLNTREALGELRRKHFG